MHTIVPSFLHSHVLQPSPAGNISPILYTTPPLEHARIKRKSGKTQMKECTPSATELGKIIVSALFKLYNMPSEGFTVNVNFFNKLKVYVSNICLSAVKY